MSVEFRGVDVNRIPEIGQRLAAIPPDAAFGSFLSELRQVVLQTGYIVAQVTVEETPLTPELESQLSGEPLDQLEGVAIDVAPTQLYVGDTFDECVRASSRLLSLKDEIAAALRSGKTAEVAADLERFTDGLAVLSTAYQDGIQILARTGVATDADVEKCHDKLKDLQRILGEVLTGLRSDDHVVVSDALEFELPDHLEELARDFSYWAGELRPSDVDSDVQCVNSRVVSTE